MNVLQALSNSLHFKQFHPSTDDNKNEHIFVLNTVRDVPKN